ncbi:MAG: DUF397 domain-containing protein [Actinomycetota bacterium]|nr:DUF397 domain-containing protein [Actinomycetota bacterium]
MNFPDSSWRKSSRSTEATACVEVASNNHIIGVRDSKDHDGHVLIIIPTEWAKFLTIIHVFT